MYEEELVSEQAMWDLLKRKTKGLVEMERITEKLNPGVPDVVYQYPQVFEPGTFDGAGWRPGPSGWVELKYLGGDKAANAVRDQVCRIPWKNADQPFWLQRWKRWGGRSGVLLYVKDAGWYYWRPWVKIAWLEFIKAPVRLSGEVCNTPDSSLPTWQCGPRLDVPELLVELRR